MHDSYPGDGEQEPRPFTPDDLEEAWFAEVEDPEKVWTDEELSVLAKGLHRNLSYWIMPPQMRAGLSTTDVSVVSGDYADKAYGKPPQVLMPQPKRVKVEFDIPTYQDLTERFADLQDVTERDIAELYLGAGLALHLLARRIKTMPETATSRLLNVLGTPGGAKVGLVDDLADAIRRADLEFNRDDIENLIHSTLLLEEERRTYVNTLRFAVGLLLGKQSELNPQTPQDLLRPASNLTTLYREDLKNRLREQQSHVNFYMKALGMTALQAQRQAAENLSELQLAVAFPMDTAEIRNVLAICRS